MKRDYDNDADDTTHLPSIKKDPMFYSLADNFAGNFSRFVDYVLRTGRDCDPVVNTCGSINNHWRPYAANCHYCTLIPGGKLKDKATLVDSLSKPVFSS